MYPKEVEQEGQVVWILMELMPIMQEQCLNCWLGCLCYYWLTGGEHLVPRGRYIMDLSENFQTADALV